MVLSRISRSKRLKIIAATVIILFSCAFARHRYLLNQITITGRLGDKSMGEISGIAASGLQNNVFYVHNDSGDTSRFFAINPSGKLLNTIYYRGDSTLARGIDDCEDIAVGPGPIKGSSYIYIADIGDNASVRKNVVIYRIAENIKMINGTVKNVKADPLYLTYPDGAKDAETLMIDSQDKLIYVVTKRGDIIYVYTTPLNFRAKDTVTLTQRCTLKFQGFKLLKWITAGDISKDGNNILLKSYQTVYYWKREKGEAVWQAMMRKPIQPNYEAEKFGEAIGFTADGKGYYTTSEGVFANIYYYKTP